MEKERKTKSVWERYEGGALTNRKTRTWFLSGKKRTGDWDLHSHEDEKDGPFSPYEG